MKKDLLQVVNEVIGLLVECDLLDRAAWFKHKRDLLSNLSEDSKEFCDELKGLNRILAGMGSFADLPMVPKNGSSLSKTEARSRQEDLAEELYEEIERLQNKGG